MNENNGMTDAELEELLDTELSVSADDEYITDSTTNTTVEAKELSIEDYQEENRIYCFPNESEQFLIFLKQFEKFSEEKLNKAILTKSDLGKVKRDEDKAHYSKIRNKFCAMHYVLNQRGLVAPAFRGLRRLTKNKHLTDSEKLLSKDRMVIDLHYLHCNYRDNVIPKRGEYKSLLTEDEFDFSLAANFAMESWGAIKKAEKLNITENIQKELLVLRCKKIIEEFRRYPKLIDDFETNIKELASQPGSRIDIKAIPQRIIEFKCLRLARGAPSEATRYWQKITGEKLDSEQSIKMVKRLSERKKWLKEKMRVSF